MCGTYSSKNSSKESFKLKPSSFKFSHNPLWNSSSTRCTSFKMSDMWLWACKWTSSFFSASPWSFRFNIFMIHLFSISSCCFSSRKTQESLFKSCSNDCWLLKSVFLDWNKRIVKPLTFWNKFKTKKREVNGNGYYIVKSFSSIIADMNEFERRHCNDTTSILMSHHVFNR